MKIEKIEDWNNGVRDEFIQALVTVFPRGTEDTILKPMINKLDNRISEMSRLLPEVNRTRCTFPLDKAIFYFNELLGQLEDQLLISALSN